MPSAELTALTEALSARGWHIAQCNHYKNLGVCCTIRSARGESVTANGYTKFDATRNAFERAGLGTYSTATARRSLRK